MDRNSRATPDSAFSIRENKDMQLLPRPAKDTVFEYLRSFGRHIVDIYSDIGHCIAGWRK